MTILPILTVPNEELRTKAARVEITDEEFWKLVEDMKETARKHNLVGLAATQVGENKAVFIMDSNATDDPSAEAQEPEWRVCINPTVFPAGNSQKEYGLEMCASLPNVVGRVDRYIDVTLDYWASGNHHTTAKLTGYQARIAQHEANHLDGKLFTDLTKMIRRKQSAVPVKQG